MLEYKFFWPQTLAQVSEKKKEEALAGSIVKIEGKDVVGTWKVN